MNTYPMVLASAIKAQLYPIIPDWHIELSCHYNTFLIVVKDHHEHLFRASFENNISIYHRQLNEITRPYKYQPCTGHCLIQTTTHSINDPNLIDNILHAIKTHTDLTEQQRHWCRKL